MKQKLNVINELDKLVTHYFKKVFPFMIDGEILEVSYLKGTPEQMALSQIITDVKDIKYPVLIVSRALDTNSFNLRREKNIPVADGTRVSVNRILKNKYINTSVNNVDIEFFEYDPPKYFDVEYNLYFYCEYMGHATEFQTMFLDRVKQEYLAITSEKFKSIYFDTV